mgnify:CR=1 FL=1
MRCGDVGGVGSDAISMIAGVVVVDAAAAAAVDAGGAYSRVQGLE